VKRPSLAAICLGLIPYAGLCFSIAWWDRATPVVLGLPFNLFWLLAWLLFIPVLMSLAYWLEKRR
jgi:hypothetical protein